MAIQKKNMFSTGSKSDGGINLFGNPLEDMAQLDKENKTLYESEKYKTKYVKIELLKDNDKNTFTVDNIKMLRSSIERLGQLQPLVVVEEFIDEKPTGNYIIRSGSRRFASIKSLYEEAKECGDKSKSARFSEVLVLILPKGATQQEIKEVITETNTTTRQISISDLFRNYDIIFAKDERGNYINIASDKNKYNAGSEMLKDMGFSYSPASVKDYLTIYEAHNKDIINYLENNLLSKNDAALIARTSESNQDMIMEELKTLPKEDIKPYLKKVFKSIKEKNKNKEKNIRGIDLLSSLKKTKKQIEKNTIDDISFIFANQREIDLCITNIAESIISLEKLKKEIESKYNNTND